MALELTLPQVAKQNDVTVRSLQRGIQSGSLQASRKVGSNLLVDDIAVTIWIRAQGRGRRWNESTARAALELLDHGETTWATGTVLSRLKARLRGLPISQLAYLLGGVHGRWNRYRSAHEQLRDHLDLIGPSKADAQQFGIAEEGGWMVFAEAVNVADLEFDLGLLKDPSGNLGLVERARSEGQARTLLDTYLLGDARESALAKGALELRLLE